MNCLLGRAGWVAWAALGWAVHGAHKKSNYDEGLLFFFVIHKFWTMQPWSDFNWKSCSQPICIDHPFCYFQHAEKQVSYHLL